MGLNEKIKEAESNTNINPTENQKNSGNYKKGKVIIKGLKVTIENPVGSYRSGKSKEGKKWKIKIPFSYGYINRTIGKDDEQVDVYLNKDMEHDFDVYIVDQVCGNTKAFDEHKVMLGFKDIDSAKKAYLKCYEKDWKGFGNITKLSLNKFKSWLNNKQMLKIPANKLNLISKMDMIEKKPNNKICVIRMFGEVLEGKTLNNLKKQAGDVSNIKELVLEIASPGGSVSEGLETMVWLDELSKKGITVITVVVANAYSIASLIMLAANIKLISKHGKVMVHNPMFPKIEYANANELEEHIIELRNLEAQMYELYQAFTGLDHAAIKKLMDKESYLLPEEAKEYGFADHIVDIKPKEFQMAQINKKEINMSKTVNSLNRVIAKLNGSNIVNQIYYDSEGGEFDIFQTDPSTIKLGDRTSVKDGVKKLADGAVVTIEEFVITEIDRAAPVEEEAVEDVPTEGVPTEDEIAAKAKSDEEAEAKVDEDVEAKAKADEEMKAKDEAEAKAKSDEEMKAKEDEDAKAKAEFNEGEAPTKKDFEAFINKMEAKFDEKFEALEKGQSEMKAKIEEGSETVAKNKVVSDDTLAIVATALDEVAKNTTSNFKPDAKASSAQDVGRGSIFQRAKARMEADK